MEHRLLSPVYGKKELGGSSKGGLDKQLDGKAGLGGTPATILDERQRSSHRGQSTP